ncbi:MAG: RNA polymerase sigma factor [Gemmataceae bacterium]
MSASDMMNEPTSPTLLQSARANDPTAWRRLVHLYSPCIFHWAKRTGLRDDDAADIVQDVWVSVSQALDRFQRSEYAGTFRGWLWTITRNKVNDRARAREPLASGGTDAHRAIQELPETEPPADIQVGAAGLVEEALDLIRSDFETHNWQAFWRTAIQGESPRDVASDLGIAPNAVHQAKFRVLKRLRQELTSLGILDDPSFARLLAQP